MVKLGLLQPQDSRHRELYRLKLPETVGVVEKVLKYPRKLRGWYEQNNNGCVGYSCSWMMTTLNTTRLVKPNIYIADWLYDEAKKVDGYPFPEQDRGTTLRAAFDVLRDKGHLMPMQVEPSKGEGVIRNEWAFTVDEVRTCIADNVPCVFGIPWYEEYGYPVKINGEWWIDRWVDGRSLGGHAISCMGASDKRQALLLVNSWGIAYSPVWIPYKEVERLLSEGAECSLPVDRLNKYKMSWD